MPRQQGRVDVEHPAGMARDETGTQDRHETREDQRFGAVRLSLLPDGKPVKDDISEVAPGILGINQRSEEAIRDYAASTLPSSSSASPIR